MVAGGVLYTSTPETLDAYAVAGCAGGPCSPLWSIKFGNLPSIAAPSFTASPVIAGDFVVLSVNVHNEGWIYAFPRRGCGSPSCPPAWRGQVGVLEEFPGGGSRGSTQMAPVVADGYIFVAGEPYLRAFPAAGCGAAVCSPSWTVQFPVGSASAMAVGGGRLFVLDVYGGVTAFPTSGCGSELCAPLWADRGSSSAVSTPALSNGRVFVSAGGHMGAIDAATGAGLWHTDLLAQDLRSSPTVVGNTVIVGSATGLHAYDVASGAPRWTAPSPGDISWTSATASRDLAYVVTHDGTLQAFAVNGCGAPTCGPVWSKPGVVSAPASGVGPVVAESRLCAALSGRQVVCLG